MAAESSLFERRLAENLRDPEFRATYEREMRAIARVQELLALVESAREEAGISKAALARATGSNPAAVRRLLTSGEGDPTLLTVLAMLDALGFDLSPRRARRPARSAVRPGESHRRPKVASHGSRRLAAASA
jgi:DNA-binding phage protein